MPGQTAFAIEPWPLVVRGSHGPRGGSPLLPRIRSWHCAGGGPRIQRMNAGLANLADELTARISTLPLFL